jgi:hypothetical protein
MQGEKKWLKKVIEANKDTARPNLKVSSVYSCHFH